jgi:hypothetical protein
MFLQQINSYMKVRDLYENATCSVARHYKEANPDFDRRYNKAAFENAEHNKAYYSTYFKTDSTPVFDKPEKNMQKKMTNKPEDIEQASPGYLGQRRVKERLK